MYVKNKKMLEMPQTPCNNSCVHSQQNTYKFVTILKHIYNIKVWENGLVANGTKTMQPLKCAVTKKHIQIFYNFKAQAQHKILRKTNL
jgi:hypothetical protein